MSNAHGVARDQLRAFISRIERLEEEKKTIADDIKDVFGEAKAMGFDTKIMKMVISLRKKDERQRTEEELVLDTYLSALGMIPAFEPETPSAPAETRGSGSAAPLQMRPEMVSEETHERPSKNDEPSPEVGPQAEASPAGTGTGTLADREGRYDGEAASVDLPTNSLIAPASQGEAEAPTPKDVSLPADGVSSEGAATGGSHVDAHEDAATHQAGVVSNPPATPGNVITEIDPPFPMKRADFAHCFPELSKADYEELRLSISHEGVHDLIVRKGDVILDGFARYNIARSLGIEYRVFEYDGTDELLDVIRWQRSSRDWTTQQESKIAKDLAKEFPHRSEDIWAAFHIAELPDGEIVAA